MFPLVRAIQKSNPETTTIELKAAGRFTELKTAQGNANGSTQCIGHVISKGKTYQDVFNTAGFKGRVEDIKRGNVLRIDISDPDDNPKLLEVVFQGSPDSVDLEATASKGTKQNRAATK